MVKNEIIANYIRPSVINGSFILVLLHTRVIIVVSKYFDWPGLVEDNEQFS